MKRKNLKFLPFALCVLMLACGKKNDTEKKDDSSILPDTTTLSGNYIAVSDPKTSEEHKQNLEQTGIGFANEMTEMQSSQAMQVMSTFSSLMSMSSYSYAAPKSLLATPQHISEIAKANGSISEMLSALSSISSTGTTLSSEWNSIVGTYTYNSTTHLFVKSVSTSALTFLFPSVVGGASNNAKIVITKPVFYTGKFTYNTDQTATEIPTSISVVLTVDNATALSYNYNLTIDQSAGTVTKLVSALTLGNYLFSYTLNNNASKSISSVYTFAHSKTILIELSAAISGDWSQAAITKYQDTPENLIQTAESYIQILNIKLNGKVDAKNLFTALNGLSEADLNSSSKIADVVNKNTSFTLNYASNDRLIATITLTPNDQSNEALDNMTFVFADGSKVDPRTYFSTGWTKLTEKLNQMIPGLVQTK